MKQTYYEILEVDKNASPEIIKKAYNTLAKKYHPDLQNENLKALYSEKLKIINEAYETLSNEEKRKEYDETLLSEIDLLKQQVANLSKENSILKNQSYSFKKNTNKIILQNFSDRIKDFYKNFLALLTTIVIVLILWQIPFIRNFILKYIFL